MTRMSKPVQDIGFLGIAIAVVLIAFVQSAETGIIRVPDDVPTIQAGLDSAFAGDTVLVDTGTYCENIRWPETYGIKLLAEEEPPESTIIDGGSADASVIEILPMLAIIDSTTEIRGFLICNGHALRGGGIAIRYASPTIRFNTLEHNGAEEYGGGICCEFSSARILFNTFHTDTAECGGAIACLGAPSPAIDGNSIHSCYATEGAGLYLSATASVVRDNTIAFNTSSDKGGAIRIEGGAPHIEGNKITFNEAAYAGGGIFACTDSSTILFNNISHNRCPQSTNPGGGVVT